MSEPPLRNQGASPAHISRFDVDSDSLLQTALKDEQSRSLIFYIENELQKFLRDPEMSRIQFPPSISPYHQELIIRISNRFGLHGHFNPLVLTKRLDSAIPRTSLQDYWRTKGRSRTRTFNHQQTSRGSDLGGKSSTPQRMGGENKTPPNSSGGASNPSRQQYNNPYASNHNQSYSNPYASHNQSNIASSNSNQKARTAPPSNNNQSAGYDNPYAAAADAQFTNEDMDQWMKTNQRRKTREQRKKQTKKAKARATNEKSRATNETKKQDKSEQQEEFNSKSRRSRPARRNRSSNQPNLPHHILHIHNFDPSISIPAFLPRNSETIKSSLSVFKSAKSPRNPFYHMCWNYNTQKGCPRGNKCNWVHCYVGAMENDYEMDHELITFQNEYGADVIFVNPNICLATFPNDNAASVAMEGNESTLFQLSPYSKQTTERLSNELPHSFFSDDTTIIESNV